MKKFSILVLILILLLPCAIFCGCGVELQSLSFNDLTKTILVDDTYSLSINAQPEIENLKITYSVSDHSIAYILPDGKTVLGVKEGQTKVYARSENGITAEMTLIVVREKTALSTPAGLSFNGNTKTLSWIKVLNAYSYNVTVTTSEKTNTYEVFTNNFNFDDFNLKYNEYTDYQFSVIAKPSSNSNLYLNSQSSSLYNFKQILSVTGLTYSDDNIIFNYDTSLLDLEESGDISFKLEVLKDGISIVDAVISDDLLAESKISYLFIPVSTGSYNVKAYVLSENLASSIYKEINIIKLSKPVITTNGTSILASGEQGDLFKYFKIVNDVQEEVSVSELTIGSLVSGEEVTYKAYAHRQNTLNKFYINSEISSLTVKKLETPSNLKVKKLPENKSAEITWNAFYPIDKYEVYVNSIKVDLSDYITEDNQHKILLNNFKNAGIYKISIISKAQPAGDAYYINSEKSIDLTVIKLDVPNIEYDEELNNFTLISPNINLGSTLNFNAFYQGQNFNLINEIINTSEKNFSLSGLEINVPGLCSTISAFSRSSTDEALIYLDSEEYTFNVTKLAAPGISYVYTDNKLKISWEAIQNADYYIQILNVTDDILVEYSGTIIQSGNVVSAEISDLKNGKAYEIYVQALSTTESTSTASSKNQYLNSEISVLSLTKLNAPTITIFSKGIETISFKWNAVNGASGYEIYIDNQKALTTTSLTYLMSGMAAGKHSFSVIAIGPAGNILPSGKVVNKNDITFYLMEKPSDITYEKSGTQAVISFNKVDYAGGYILQIEDADNLVHEFTSYTISNGRVRFTLSSDYFNKSGEYTVYVYALSDIGNVIETNAAKKQIFMLEKVSSISIDEDNLYIVWEHSGTRPVSGYEIYIDSVLMSDYEFKDEQNQIQMRYYIGNLPSGIYNVSVISKGDNDITIDSLPLTIQINKKENISIPATISFGLEKPNDVNSKFKLVFSEVEHANFYVITIIDQFNNLIHSIEISSLNSDSLTQLIDRSLFDSGLQYLFIRAYAEESDPVYANSDMPDLNDLNHVVKIFKSETVQSLTVNNNQINLFNYQAIINDLSYSNVMYSIPALTSGGSINFIARRTESTVDSILNNIFYMAGDWVPFQIIKLETPAVHINENGKTISWSNINSENIDCYDITIEFYGLGNSVIKTVNFTRETDQLTLTYNQIKDLILEELDEELINYVGDYKIYIKAVAVPQKNQIIYLSSYLSENETDFTISENLNNDLISADITSEGIVKLTINKNDSNFMTRIDLNITQGANASNLQLNFDGTCSILNNTLNAFETAFYSISEDIDNIYLMINIQKVVNDLAFSVSWRIIGDEVYSISPAGTKSLNSLKLTTPSLIYSNDEFGNYITIAQNVLATYDENVIIYAQYNNEFLTFINGALLLPYEWKNVSEIYVYATKNMAKVVRSNKVKVTMNLYNKVTNIRLENDNNSLSSNFDYTFLRWNSASSETSWVVYIYYNSGLISRKLVNSRELKLTPELLPDSGSYTFKITAYGNNSTYFNSNLTEFAGTKLSSTALSLSNTNGVLNWMLNSVGEDDLSYFRICIENSKETFEKNIYLDALLNYSGMLAIKIRAIGNVAKNIISSDYTQIVNFYKYYTPETFKISAGEFAFGTENDNNVTDNLFRIVIGSNTYSYQNQSGIDSIDAFYESNVTSGTASAYIKGGETKAIGGISVLTLKSNSTTGLSFNRLEVESENEERYLTQAITDGQATTYFHWSWTETGNITTRTAVIYIKPTGSIEPNDIAGWNKKIKDSGSLGYYYLTIKVNASFDGSITTLSITKDLPRTLIEGEYIINVKKSDENLDGSNLSSKLENLINFVQLAKPSLSLIDGKLAWQNISSASGFYIRYRGDKEGYINLGKVNNYELETLFADSSNHLSYNFKIFALGNITTEKPVVYPTTYFIAGQTSTEISVIKPRTAGDLILSNGGLGWNEAYHTYRANGAVLEFVFYDSTNTEIARVKDVPASEFDGLYPDLINVLEEYSYTCKSNFKPGAVYTIKYRELGYSSFANSEYKSLKNNIVIEGNEKASLQFKLAPTINKINISDNGLIWTPPTVPAGELQTIYYDIFFKLDNTGYTYATTLTSTAINPVNSISIAELKALATFQDNISSIIEIFVSVRGDSNNYISGFNSPTLGIKAIEGETGLSIQDGLIKWNHIDGAYSYQIKTTINNQNIVYEIYQDGANYKLKKYVDNDVIFDQVSRWIKFNETTWTWDWAQDENIEPNTKYELYIRYVPDAGNDVYAIPGEYSIIGLSVYKLALPVVTIVDGNLTWQAIENANGYKIYIKYLNDENEVIETFETISLVNSLKIRNYGQNRIQVAVQAIGPTESVNSIHYINTSIEYNSISYELNTINNFVRENDIVKWEDSSSETNSYDLMIYSGEILSETHTTTNKSFNLSSLNLSSLLDYKVVIKVKGVTGTIGEGGTGILSSEILDNSIMFKVLPAVEDINTEYGEILWKENVNKTDYKIVINSASGNSYIYIVGLENNQYIIKSLLRNGMDVSQINSYVTTTIVSDATYIKLWPAEIEENFSLNVLISAIGITKDDKYYVSSKTNSLTSTVLKCLSTNLNPTYTFENSILTISWRKNTEYKYDIRLLDSLQLNSPPSEIFKEETVTANTKTYDFTGLASGSYKFQIQRYAIDKDALILRSNILVVSITIP